MKCPQCSGDWESVLFQGTDGSAVPAKRCNQCSGFWFERPPLAEIAPSSVVNFDTPQPNYSLKNLDLLCPLDKTPLDAADFDQLPNGARYWSCPDCEGRYYPKGQLALITATRPNAAGLVITWVQTRTQAAVASLLVAVGGIAVVISSTKVVYQAAENQTLPTGGPNIFALVMLALTYLAGTVLAVLGRKLPIIFMGWAVIVVCLLGFSIIIFGP